jgi:hypothetical protein
MFNAKKLLKTPMQISNACTKKKKVARFNI